jgi:hypothetical protein
MDRHGLRHCPRCAGARVAGTSAREFCGYCGHEWQADAPGAQHRAEPDPETPDGRDQRSRADPWDRPAYDDLTTGVLPVERLRTWYVAPQTEPDRAAARRFLDSLAER